jgi:hypothetical protein
MATASTETKQHLSTPRASAVAGALALVALGGCNLFGSSDLLPAADLRPICGTQTLPPQCGQVCQDANVAYAIDNAMWLLHDQNVAGKPAGALNVTGACPLGGNVAITGTVTVASNGVEGLQLAFAMTQCGVSGSTYSLVFDGTVQANGTFTNNVQNDVTFSAAGLTLSGPLMLLDNPTVSETCPVSITDTWNFTPGETGWLNGQVCGRTADDSAPGASGVTAVDPGARCLLESMTLTENGQPVELLDVPDTALAAPDGGLLGAADAASAPEITSAPSSLALVSGTPDSLDLQFSDPTASTPAFLFTLRPRGAFCNRGFCGCFGCRITHRRYDKQTAGTVHYQVATASDPVATTELELIAVPASCAETTGDPAAALTSAPAANCTPITGAPAGVGITLGGAPLLAGGSSGSQGGSGSTAPSGSSASAGASSGGGASGGACAKDSDCSAGMICAGGSFCNYQAGSAAAGIAASCDCSSSPRRCAALGIPACFGAGGVAGNTYACCQGLINVTGTCQTSAPAPCSP